MNSAWKMLTVCALLSCAAGGAMGHGAPQGPSIPFSPDFSVTAELPPPPQGVTELKFSDFFRMPVGPKGLQPTDKLLQLDGKRVRLVGYMVRDAEPLAGKFIFTALPVSLPEENERLSNDLPPATVFVYLQDGKDAEVTHIQGLIHLTGVLEVGNRAEPDGQVSSVRLRLDAETSRKLPVSPQQHSDEAPHAVTISSSSPHP